MKAESLAVRPPRRRIGEWLRRYGPAEVAAIIGALTAATVVSRAGHAAGTAIASALGEAVAFYAVILVRDVRRRLALGDRQRVCLRTARDLFMEFGPAEILDVTAVRPLAMYLGPLLVGSMAPGVLLGKIGADAVFYTLAIIGYETQHSRLTKAAQSSVDHERD